MLKRLKSLELHGYKTFATRVVFEFPGQITAIVGPNGSGKSNIADAMRWVLGEQSYTLLRGRKTEDMIFAGSEQRPRAGMAVASISFFNEDGWLPIDYSEVSISRRAYRDGDNEYVLNGQRVRLKEINELLGQSGLSERTYTIIGQGLVDAALSLKPEERRRFFEEAAGIGLYRARREESLNRLETTGRNLERVQDILSELDPRLKSLERQAQRAAEHERITADLKVLLREWYGYHWHRVQMDIEKARDLVRQQEQILDTARGRLEQTEHALETIRQQMVHLRSNLNAWHAELSAMHAEWERVSRQLAVLDERQRSYLQQEQALAGDLARVEEEDASRAQQWEQAKAERARLELEMTDAARQWEDAQKALALRQQERQKIEADLREARRQVVQSETRLVQLKAHQAELQNRQQGILRSRTAMEQEQANAEDHLKVAEAQLQQAMVTQHEAQKAYQDAEQGISAGQTQLRELEIRRKEQQDLLSRLDAQRSRLIAQLEVLEHSEKSLSGVSQGTRTVLEAARSGRLKGAYRVVNQVIDVPVELELAIAAALGDSLDGIWLGGQEDPDLVLVLLEESSKGRAVIYPQEWARHSTLDLQQDDDCLGVASQLIRVEPEHQPLVNWLLGQVVVVKHRGAARRVLARLPVSAKVVTLKGEVFLGDGSVIAGQENRAAVAGKMRQKRELQETLAQVEMEWKEQQALLAEVESQWNQLRSTQGELQKNLQSARTIQEQASHKVQQANLSLSQVKQKAEWQIQQGKVLADQLARTDAEIRQNQADLDRIEVEIKSHRQRVQEYLHQLDALPMDELQSQGIHWKTTLAVSERAVATAVNREDEYRKAVEAGRQRQADIQNRQIQLGEALQVLLNEQQSLRLQEEDLNRKIQQSQEQIQPAEEEMKALEVKFNQAQQDQIAAQQATAVADRHATQAQLEYARLRENFDSLRRRIEEDFGLVDFEYTTSVSGQTPLPLEGMVSELPKVKDLSPDVEENINRYRAQLRRLGAINPEALSEYRAVKERKEFLTQQVADLRKADADLRQVIAELDALMKQEFRKTFDAVAIEFKEMFTRLFGGGSAKLLMTDEDHPTETGIDIEARLPGRREQGLSLLSGGERSLTAVALIFSLLKVSPTPFCVLDEVDAMLDEANVGRFCDLLRELSHETQFVVITHNRNTVQTADVIYGVTMGRDSASQVISLRLDEVSEEMVR